MKPFDNINVRKAVVAAIDSNALRLAFGGPLVGDIPTHFIPPGHRRASSRPAAQKGPGLDFMHKPNGDMALAASYMKKAGFPSGKYTGGETLQMVADSATRRRRRWPRSRRRRSSRSGSR